MTDALRIGTCSWKYESWRGLVYPDALHVNHLAAYAKNYDCVEIDQWFWSLYGPDKVALPQARVVEEYAGSVPEHFRFGVKMPNALTLTHFRQKSNAGPLLANPHFLSIDVLTRFLERLGPMRERLGPLMFQFGYLNKRMVPSQAPFLEALAAFVQQLPVGHTWCVETRNPNYLNAEYFAFLQEHGLGHVFLQGYYMPPIFGLYEQHADRLTSDVVIRLHGPDREGMEERTGGDWSKRIAPKEAELGFLVRMLEDLGARGRTVWLFVNNHYEGCAPLTIERIRERMAR